MNEITLNIIIDVPTKRLDYIFDFIFNDLLNIPFKLIVKENYYGDSLPNLIHYGGNKPKNGIWFKSHSLLFENGVNEINFEYTEYQNFKYPFSVGEGGIIPFDPFALSFYFLTQYEEHLPNIPIDSHGRFDVSKSNIFKYIEYPMVEISALIIRNLLIKSEISIPPKTNHFSFLPTFDIDIAFAHLAKPVKRHILGSAKLIAKAEISEISNRLKVWTHHQHDSYDVFDVILNSLTESNLNAIFFALVAKNTRFDNNNSPKSKRYKELLIKLSKQNSIELHSSYYVSNKKHLFEIEKANLEEIIQKRVISNRQHFLRYRLPEYWSTLVKHNISNDYSVGFTNFWGYRSGTSKPHLAFDLMKNEIFPLQLHPFIFMDTALQKMYHDDIIQINDKMIQIIEETKKSGYPLIGVWHNYAMPHDSLQLECFINVISQAK